MKINLRLESQLLCYLWLEPNKCLGNTHSNYEIAQFKEQLILQLVEYIF